MKGSKGKPRAGAVRKAAHSKQVGTGGHGRKALEGKGPTPKAEDRSWHVAGKRKAAQERYEAAGGKGKVGQKGKARSGAPRGASGASQRARSGDESEIVTGRNSVLEALRTRLPATTLYLAQRVEMDDRVREALKMATNRGIPVLEVTRPELDRLAGDGGVHQGIDAAECLQRRVRDDVACLGIGKVGRREMRLGAQRLDFRRDGCAARLVTACDDDRFGAVLRGLQGDRAADALRRPGHDQHDAGEG